MEYELQLKPFVGKEGWKYKTIQITDIAFHTAHKQPTHSIGKKIAQALKFKKPGRIYAPIDNTASSPALRAAIIDLLKNDPEFLKMVQDEEKNGYKILIALPKEIPVFAGKDTIEFIASSNGQRILRRLAKNK